jgi:hypothetical protein
MYNVESPEWAANLATLPSLDQMKESQLALEEE